jgi:hypothetical protein
MAGAKLSIVVLAVAAGALWIEHSHRIRIETSAPVEVAGHRNASTCPENDSVPFSADCIVLLQGRAQSDAHLRMNAADGPLPASPELP